MIKEEIEKIWDKLIEDILTNKEKVMIIGGQERYGMSCMGMNNEI